MRKGSAGSAGQALRGSGDFHAWTDSALYLHGRHGRIVLRVEHRNAAAPDPFELHLASAPDGTDTHLELLDPSDPDPAPSRNGKQTSIDGLAELLRTSPRPLTRVDLRRKLGVNNERLGLALKELEARGLIHRSQQGWSSAEDEGVSYA